MEQKLSVTPTKHDIANKGLTMVVGTVSTAVMSMLQGIIISRVLGPAGTGQYQLSVTLSITLITFFSLGMGLANIYFLNHHKINPKQIVMNSLAVGLFLGLFSSLTIFYFFTFKKNYAGALGPWAKIIFSSGLCFMVLQVFMTQILIAKMKVRQYIAVGIVSSFVNLFLCALLGALGLLSPGAALIIYSLYQITMATLSLYFLREDISFAYAPDFRLIWRTFKYGLQLYVANLLLTLDQNISLLMIGFLMPGQFDAAGYYSRAVTLCGLIRLLPTAMTNLLYSHWAAVQGQERTRQVERVIRIYLLFGVAFVITLILAGKYLMIVMYGRAFLPAVIPLQILGFQQTMWMISNVFQALFAGSGKPTLTTVNIGGGNMVSLAGSFVLIPVLGIVGAAIALTCGQAVYTFLNLLQARKYFGLNFRNCLAFNRQDLTYFLSAMRRRKKSTVLS